jgi:hypothetical protein
VSAATAKHYGDLTTHAVAAFLIAGTLIAQDAKVVPIMSEDLAVSPGEEGLTITVVYSPGFGSLFIGTKQLTSLNSSAQNN